MSTNVPEPSPDPSQESTAAPQSLSASNPPEGQSEPASADTPASSDTNVAARPKIQVGKSTLGPRPAAGPPGGGRRPGGRPGAAGRDRSGGERGPKGSGPAKKEARPGEEDDGPPTKGSSDKELFDDSTSARRANVPVPSKRDRGGADLEAEIDAAFGDLSLDDIVGEGLVSRATQAIDEDARLRATVIRMDRENVFFSLGGKNEGLVKLQQFKTPPAIGSELDVVVKRLNPEDGLYELVVPGASIEVGDWNDLTVGAVVEARVSGANTGGLECMVNNIRGFIPASQVGLYRIENFGDFVNQKLLCVVMEVNPTRKNLVLSRRALLEREQEESRRKLLAELEPGQIRDGVIRSVKDFGAFVDLGGVDGMIHVSKLSWDRIKHPSEVVQEGQKVRVKIERIDEQTGKISLSYRDLLDRPWDQVDQNFPVGATVRGAVSRIANFGAFVKLAPGVEGLIHVSELAHGRVRRVEDVLKEGQEVEVKILSVDKENQRIALSYKATLPPPQAEAGPAEEEADEPPRPLAVPARNRPLRGGIDRSSGGTSHGLNW